MRVFKRSSPPLPSSFWVLGCIYAGIATPLEAAGAGAFAHGVCPDYPETECEESAGLSHPDHGGLRHAYVDSHGGAAYNFLVNITRLSDAVPLLLQAPIWTACPDAVLLIFALFFCDGMFLDTTPIIMIAIPILLPVIQASSWTPAPPS